MRGQTTLPVLGVALLVVTSVSLVVVLVGQGAVHGASEPSLERSTAVALSERLVANSSALAVRPNVLSADKLDSLDGNYLREKLGVADGLDVAIRLDDEVLLDTGVGTDYTSFERIIIVQQVHERRRTPPVRAGAAITLPRRVEHIGLRVQPGPNTTVHSVTADGQVLLHDASGLSGWYDLRLSRFETTGLTVAATGPLGQDDLTLRYAVPERRPATMEVRVDA
jgi:hypothetical protein